MDSIIYHLKTGNRETTEHYGDLKQSSFFGDRTEMRIAFSDSALNTFEQDERAVRGTTRFDIVNANVGSATEAGAIVALVL